MAPMAHLAVFGLALAYTATRSAPHQNTQPPAQAASFNVSNTLGDTMVLQRGNATVVWGFGHVGLRVTTTLAGRQPRSLSPPAVVGPDGVWRQLLPHMEASTAPLTIMFNASDGTKAQLRDLLVGDVFLCGGQSK